MYKDYSLTKGTVEDQQPNNDVTLAVCFDLSVSVCCGDGQPESLSVLPSSIFNMVAGKKLYTKICF